MSRPRNQKTRKAKAKPPTLTCMSETNSPPRRPNRDYDEEFESPGPLVINKSSKSGAPLWIASKYQSETAFTFVMDDEELGRFLEPFGCKDPDFVLNLLRQVVKVGKLGPHADQATIEFYFAAIAAIKPRDAIDLMLAAQMAALQPLIMAQANKLAHAEDLAESDSAERTTNKLSRTFCKVVETFDRHRESREQKVTLQQISVAGAADTDPSNVISSDNADRMQEPARHIPKIDSPELVPIQEGPNAVAAIQARQNKNGRRSPP